MRKSPTAILGTLERSRPFAACARFFPAAFLLSAAFAGPLEAQEELIIKIGDDWSYWKGVDADPDDWIEADFDDSDWLVGPTGIGYGDNDDATILGDMQNAYLSILARRTFTVADPRTISSLTLRIVYDDGFIAYLNGSEIGRANMPNGDVTESTAAVATIEPGAPILLAVDPTLLQAGRNVLAIRVHNATLASSDLSFIPELVVNADSCFKTLTCSFTIGSGATLTWTSLAVYDSITIRRNGVVLDQGLDGSLQTYLDPDPPPGRATYEVIAVDAGKPCPPVACEVIATRLEDLIVAPDEEWTFRKGDSPPPAGWTSTDFDDSSWESGPTGIGYGDGDDATLLDDMETRSDDPLTPEDEFLPGYASVFVRKSFQLSSLDGLKSLVFAVSYDDGLVAYLNGEEIGRANMPAGDVTETTFALIAVEPGAPIQLEIPASKAIAGRNVLAVSVHNAALTSSDLSFVPTLSRLGGVPTGVAFRRGDADDSGGTNISDAVFILRGLFQGGASARCPDAADVDDSGTVNISDAVYLLRLLFQGGAPIPAPGAVCGVDPTADNLGPCGATSC